jgi:hypothetical protein
MQLPVRTAKLAFPENHSVAPFKPAVPIDPSTAHLATSQGILPQALLSRNTGAAPRTSIRPKTSTSSAPGQRAPKSDREGLCRGRRR